MYKCPIMYFGETVGEGVFGDRDWLETGELLSEFFFEHVLGVGAVVLAALGFNLGLDFSYVVFEHSVVYLV